MPITYNSTTGDGGGFYSGGGNVNLVNSTLSNNTAGGKGPGGAFAAPDGTWTQSGSTITDAVVAV